MIVNDIFSIPSLASDVRIISANDIGKAEIADLWNTWESDDLPFDLATKPITYMSTTADNTIVIAI